MQQLIKASAAQRERTEIVCALWAEFCETDALDKEQKALVRRCINLITKRNTQ